MKLNKKKNGICSIFVDSQLSQCDGLIRNTSAYRHSLMEQQHNPTKHEDLERILIKGITMVWNSQN